MKMHDDLRKSRQIASAALDQMPPRVLRMSIPRVVNTAREWWRANHVLDDLDSDRIHDDLARVADACGHLGVTTYRELHRHAADVIKEVTSLASPTAYALREDADALNRTRNSIGAALSAVAQHHGADAAIAIAAMPDVAPRAGGSHRLPADDEILLLRQRALHTIVQGGQRLIEGCQYSLVETGMTPVETTEIRGTDFDHLRAPTTVHSKGGPYNGERTLALPPWACPVVAARLDEQCAGSDRAVHDRLCFTGKPGAIASASAATNLRRYMYESGFTLHDRPVPQAIVGWRVARVMTAQGWDDAQILLGKKQVAQVERFLGQFIIVAPEIPKLIATFDGF
ncbi:hypothetical protein [Nocardioides taihuensis]|uniref:Integrase n=1 Tax=Nocardioides taihuensis TaxID=1835606 RepID=A0ABW0BEH1_9ACTN